MDPADFYTGLVVELYSPLKSGHEDPERYARFVLDSGEPALELGCGDGDPLLALRALDLDVEGVDSSADMLARCRELAAREGIDVVVHHQRMEELDLDRSFRSIFLAGPTFNLLPDDDTALAALRRIRTHLTPDGTALVPLFVPSPTPTEQLGLARGTTRDDGAVLRVGVTAEERDEKTRVQRSTLRYERVLDGLSTVDERVWTIHWYSRDGFRDLARAAGLEVVDVQDDDGHPAAHDASDVTFVLRAAR
ncbi:class I SAM-dependent methyltransferase [Oerskovia enterophila]|uniref:dTDP-3-amino-3,6-dideoxy-alpha-D-glucopyranose N,N-dimethyltransferase n=1 Tax=Oerskovia enterophila TaxID=43678 RepID=A0A161XEF4_9CELL|nr:class I SAM-dependent methyltransferase [Oerskovia enterophila]KZM35097.1 dTDP-3-amino-3,6-dideoxy-alpha-D-glucopyranose N,N-dimethyltransferase [Oerskovia enterophila]